jgi:hypothetical protein
MSERHGLERLFLRILLWFMRQTCTSSCEQKDVDD